MSESGGLLGSNRKIERASALHYVKGETHQ